MKFLRICSVAFLLSLFGIVHVKAESPHNFTFTNSFYDIPTIIVTGQNMATGDFFTITNKAKTGFTVTFFNSSNTIISKTFDFQAIGYGLKN